MTKKRGEKEGQRGNLRIGDHWNAINILALSQSNPLKAIAEFVENSIDAGATLVHVFRGKKDGEPYLRIVDNGRGIPRSPEGEPDFKYVATHIGDSIKRHLKAKGALGIQGEYGIGLLSFWTVGERLTLRSSAADGHVHQMTLIKGKPGYQISRTRALLSDSGTELVIQPHLPGLRQVTGEKLQWYLGVELRNRILDRGVAIHIHDLTSRNELRVEPQRYEGRKLVLPAIEGIRPELYLNDSDQSHRVAVYRHGTRVLDDLGDWPELDPAVWRSGNLSGYVECPSLQLTPGTRLGVIQDERFEAVLNALRGLEAPLRGELALLKQAAEDKASKLTQQTLHRAFRDALNDLPREEYDWFDAGGGRGTSRSERGQTESPRAGEPSREESTADADVSGDSAAETAPVQPAFFDFAGPLHSARIAPKSSIVGAGGRRRFRAIARDRKGTPVSEELSFEWRVLEGPGIFEPGTERQQELEYLAPPEAGLARLEVMIRQGELTARAEAVVTITESLAQLGGNASEEEDASGSGRRRRTLPDFTYERAPGAPWRSRYEASRNLVVINNGHRDFLFASTKSALKLRYLVRLISKELVLANFSGLPSHELMDRLIEVSLRAEESLR
ncbi:MAG: ATP-binding protein [Oligoflexia bacterium]|nr:ATP-binding protein [Oligoflexia bacterium]